MEQPCYKCGQAVEEGVPFCPHCMAPQIWVVVEAPVPMPAAPSAAATLPASQTVPVLAVPMQWSRAVAPCALAALIAFVLMSLGLYPLVGLPGAGFLAVVFYRARRGMVGGAALAGAKLGALSGLLCFVIPTLFVTLAAAMPDIRIKIRGQIAEYFQKVAATRPTDAEFQHAIAQLKTPEGLVLLLIVAALLSVVLGSAGGAVGGAIFGRRDHE